LISAGAPPQTLLGQLTALPRLPSWNSGGLLLRGGKGGESKIGEVEREKGREKWRGGGKRRVRLPKQKSSLRH